MGSEMCIRDRPRLLAAERGRVLVLSCHACAYLTEQIVDACGARQPRPADFCVMPCCQRAGPALKRASKELGVELGVAMDFVLLGARRRGRPRAHRRGASAPQSPQGAAGRTAAPLRQRAATCQAPPRRRAGQPYSSAALRLACLSRDRAEGAYARDPVGSSPPPTPTRYIPAAGKCMQLGFECSVRLISKSISPMNRLIVGRTRGSENGRAHGRNTHVRGGQVIAVERAAAAGAANAKADRPAPQEDEGGAHVGCDDDSSPSCARSAPDGARQCACCARRGHVIGARGAQDSAEMACARTRGAALWASFVQRAADARAGVDDAQPSFAESDAGLADARAASPQARAHGAEWPSAMSPADSAHALRMSRAYARAHARGGSNGQSSQD